MKELQKRRPDIIKAAQTPLGVFVLAILAVESMTVAVVVSGLATNYDRTILISGALIVILISMIFTFFSKPQQEIHEKSYLKIKEEIYNLKGGLEETQNNIAKLFPTRPSSVNENEWNIILGSLKDHVRSINGIYQKIDETLKIKYEKKT